MIMRMDDGGLRNISAPEIIQRNRLEDGAYIEAPNLVKITPSAETQPKTRSRSLQSAYYILMFSPQCFTSPFYSVHFAYSIQLMGGLYERNEPDTAILQKNYPIDKLFAPGGASAVVGTVQGNTFEVVFHANMEEGPPGVENPRQMWVGRFRVTVDGGRLKVGVARKG